MIMIATNVVLINNIHRELFISVSKKKVWKEVNKPTKKSN